MVKIQRIQCRAARLVSGIFDWNIRGADIVRRLGWQTVREIILQQLLFLGALMVMRRFI